MNPFRIPLFAMLATILIGSSVASASSNSDIVAVPSSETGGISSMANDPSPLAAGDGEQVWQITVRDGGGTPDADALPTILTSLTLSAGPGNQVPDWSAVILANGLFNGLTALGEGVVTASGITFSPLALAVPDDGSITLTVNLTVKTTLPAGSDNKSFQFRVQSTDVSSGDVLVSSQFWAFPSALSTATENRVQVVATKLAFTVQPSTPGNAGVNIAPVAAIGLDANNNTDDDFSAPVTLSSTVFTLASTDPGGLTHNAVAGTASWTNLSASNGGTGTVDAASAGLLPAFSNPVTIFGPTVTSIASGNWNAGTTWDQGIPPQPAQDVIIGHTVTLTAIDTAKSVTVNSGGVLDVGTFRLGLPGTYTLNAGAEGRQSGFVAVPGGGLTPWAFDDLSTYTIHGSSSGFSIGSVPGITFGSMNWNSTGNGTPPVGTVITGDLTLGGSAEMRCGTGSTSRTIIVDGNVVINSGVLVTSNASGAVTGGIDVGGDLTINAAGTLRGVNSTGPGTLTLAGNLINNGGTIQVGDGVGDSGIWTVYLPGTNAVTLDPGTVQAFRNVRIGAGKTVNLLNNVTIGSTYTFADSGTLNCGTSVISGGGSFVLAAGGTLGIGSPAGIAAGFAATGNIQTATSRLFDGNATYVYNGSVAQLSGDGLPPAVTALTINNAAGVALDFNHTVTGTLTLQSGNVDAGAFILDLAPGGTLARTGGHVIGALQKTIPVSGGAGSQVFEIGDASTYTPVTISGTSYAAPFPAAVSTSPGEHPNLAGSGIIATRSLNRSYTIVGTPSGPSDVTFTFAPGDVDGSANTGAFVVGRYNSPVWSILMPGTRTASSTQALGVAGFSSFAIGEAITNVTFQVNMKVKAQNGLFDPTADAVTVRGSFNDWGNSTNNPDTLTDADNDSIYVKTIPLAPFAGYAYKFWKTLRGGVEWEDGIDDRSLTLGPVDTTLAPVYFQNDGPDVPVTFQVDMSVKMLEQTFLPDSGDVVRVRGNFNGWGESVAMTDPENDSTYALTLQVPSGKNAVYKFFKTPRGGVDWEGDPNRDYAIPLETPTVIPPDFFGRDSIPNLPSFAVTPAVLTFGFVSMGDSLDLAVKVLNTGNGDLVVTGALVSGSPDFAFVGTTPVTILPSDSALLAIRFTPTVVGPVTGTLAITHNAAGSPGSATLSATGLPPGPPPAFLTVTPDTIIAKDPVKGKFWKPVKRFKGLMPNWANLLDETVAQGGFQPGSSGSDSAGGMLIGTSWMLRNSPDPLNPKWKPIKDSAAVRAWVRLTKWDFKKAMGKGFNALQKTLEDKTGTHDLLPARGFDFTTDGKNKPLVKQMTKLVPKKQDNALFAEFVAFKLNIAASGLGKTPGGFGQLVYDNDSSMFDENEVTEVSNRVDSMMTYWQLSDSTGFADAYSTLYAINRAFVGPFDTAGFNTGGLVLKGTVDITMVPYLKLPVPFVATRLQPTTAEYESGEDTEFEDEEFEESLTPVAAKLYQNYPNPFNPGTTIGFRLLESSQVTVRIYDMLGQVVATLLTGEEMEEGYNEIRFNAGDLSSGVYFYRIVVQGLEDAGLRSVVTNKMLLLK